MYVCTFLGVVLGVVAVVIETELPIKERVLYVMLFSVPFLAIVFTHITLHITGEWDYKVDVQETVVAKKKKTSKQTTP